jgi:hypothetical protein
MDCSVLKLSFSVDNKNKMKLKKDAMEYVDLLQEYLKDPKYKTELCKTYAEKKFCVYGNKCRFAHGKEELFHKAVNHPKYKVKKCISFFQHSFCAYGSRCHFQHEERRLKSTFRSYYSYLLNLQALNYNEVLDNENITFFDEKDPILVNINNRPISPNLNSSISSNPKDELIWEKLRKKRVSGRLAIFQQITDGKRASNMAFNESKFFLKANCFYPMF